MKIKEAFAKISVYNEIAALESEEQKAIWFEDVLLPGVTDGEKFSRFEDFRKFVRKEYFKEVADAILGSDDWELNEEKELTNNLGRKLTFGLYVTAA